MPGLDRASPVILSAPSVILSVAKNLCPLGQRPKKFIFRDGTRKTKFLRPSQTPRAAWLKHTTIYIPRSPKSRFWSWTESPSTWRGKISPYFCPSTCSSIPFGNRKLDMNFHECKAITFSLEKSYSTHSFPRIFPGEPNILYLHLKLTLNSHCIMKRIIRS